MRINGRIIINIVKHIKLILGGTKIMGFFNSYKVEKEKEPKKSGGNSYDYKVTDKETGKVEYLTQKGLDACKKWIK